MIAPVISGDAREEAILAALCRSLAPSWSEAPASPRN
jgi:hypothetical protein